MTFDYIVVGAGASGCVVASRLSESGAKVLLVEAGDDPGIGSRIPSLSSSLLGSGVDWHYATLPNGISCLASQGEQCSFSRGKVLGGSTAINFMMYTRGNRRDYDNWNITGWTWDDLKPFFLKFENLMSLDKLPASSAAYHNTDGPMNIEFFTDSQNDWHQRIIDGFLNLSFPYNPDVNAESQIGVSQVIGYVNDGERQSAARGYLSPAWLRTNLRVAKNSQVTGVILDDIENIALGVTALLGGTREVKLYATKEVILSAGAIGTPQLLMLSGIGPAEHLKSLNIPVRVDNSAVGDGLADHVFPLMFVKVDRGFGIDFPNLIPFVDDGYYVTKWLLTQDGPYASNGLTDVTGFVNTECYDFENHKMGDSLSEKCEVPNLQCVFSYIDRNIFQLVESTIANAMGLQQPYIDQLANNNVNFAFITISPILLNPASRGNVTLYSNNPLDPPKINPNYLGSKKDVDQIMKSIPIIKDLIETEPFKMHNASILKLEFEACSGFVDDSDEYWECYVRQMTHSVFHATSTTAVGRVVDEGFRVKGVGRLRVVDAGVMPTLVSGNTAASCLALGEMAADKIAREHNLIK